MNSALYRHDAGSSALTALVLPGMGAPGGGQFVGVYFNSNINAQRRHRLRRTRLRADIDPNTPPGVDGIGLALFKADSAGNITALVRPGDAAAGGGVFDAARAGTINNAGDIAFSGHTPSLPCSTSAILFSAARAFTSAMRPPEPSSRWPSKATPAGGKTYRIAFDDRINTRGDVAFIGDVSPGDELHVDVGFYRYNRVDGTTTIIAQPGIPCPGEVTSSARSDTRWAMWISTIAAM